MRYKPGAVRDYMNKQHPDGKLSDILDAFKRAERPRLLSQLLFKNRREAGRRAADSTTGGERRGEDRRTQERRLMAPSEYTLEEFKIYDLPTEPVKSEECDHITSFLHRLGYTNETGESRGILMRKDLQLLDIEVDTGATYVSVRVSEVPRELHKGILD